MLKKPLRIIKGNKPKRNANIRYSEETQQKHKVIRMLEDLNSGVNGEYTGYMLIGYKDEPELADSDKEDKTSFGYGWRYCDFPIDRRSMVLAIAHQDCLTEDE